LKGATDREIGIPFTGKYSVLDSGFKKISFSHRPFFHQAEKIKGKNTEREKEREKKDQDIRFPFSFCFTFASCDLVAGCRIFTSVHPIVDVGCEAILRKVQFDVPISASYADAGKSRHKGTIMQYALYACISRRVYIKAHSQSDSADNVLALARNETDSTEARGSCGGWHNRY